MSECADDNLRVRTDIDGMGAVFRLCEPVYANLESGRPGATSALKYEVGVRPAWVVGTLAIPIFDDAAEWAKENTSDRCLPVAALVIDRDADFSTLLLDPDEQDALANVAAIVGEEIRDRTIVPEARSVYPKAGPSGWDRSLGTPHLRLVTRKVRDPGAGALGARIGSALRRLAYEK
jgi:hypothetical protein